MSNPRIKRDVEDRLADRVQETKERTAGPTSSSRVANESGTKPGSIVLSPERVQAIKDAGAWYDEARRNKMIRAYMSYDRQNKG